MIRRSIRIPAAAIPLLLLAACTPATRPTHDILRQELEKSRGVWRGAEVSSYNYRFDRICDCPPETVRPVRIRVVEGAVDSVFTVGTGAAVDSSDVDELFDVTIDDLFAAIEHALAAGAYSVAAEYDRVLGYPRSISIDYDHYIVDEDVEYRAEILKR